MEYWSETRFLGALTDIASFLHFALRRFFADGLGQAAGALTFSTLLAMVPLLVIAFAVLSGFSVFDPVKLRLEALLLSILVPEVSSEIKSYLANFTRNASNLTEAGIVAVPITAVLLLSTIETTLNRVWRVDKPRPLMTRLLVFWALLTFGPLLLGVSFTLTTNAMSSVQVWAKNADYVQSLALSSNWLQIILAVLTQSVGFSLLYIVVPARRVRIRDAAIGGVFAGLGFQVLRWVFNTFLTSATTYTTIYGAVAVVPIFLIWMYLSWTVIILGAVLSASFPDWWRRRDPLTGLRLSPAEKLEVAVALLSVLRRKSEQGGAITHDQLAEAIPLQEREPIIGALQNVGYIVETEDERLSLARDLHSTSMSQLARDLGLTLGRRRDVVERPALKRVADSSGLLPELLVRLKHAEDEILNASIAQVIEGNASEDLQP